MVVIAMFLTQLACAKLNDENIKPKQFKTTITITYNQLTLAEASKKEAEAKKIYGDACKVDISLQDGDTISGTVWNNAYSSIPVSH